MRYEYFLIGDFLEKSFAVGSSCIGIGILIVLPPVYPAHAFARSAIHRLRTKILIQVREFTREYWNARSSLWQASDLPSTPSW